MKSNVKTVHNEVPNEHTTSPEGHYKDWPNAVGFDVRGDTRETIDLPISGHFPNYVAGSLYRTGPGQSKVPLASKDQDFVISHWFDGFTTIHKFDLTPGDKDRCSGATYSSYNQTDELIENVRKTGKIDDITFAQKRDPCDSLYKKLKTVFRPTSSPPSAHKENIGVDFRETLPVEADKTNHNGRRLLTVVSDATVAKQFDADTLEPLGVTDQHHIHKDLTGPLSAAHASHDPETGDIFNYNLAFGAKSSTYRIFRASPTTGEVEILATISGYDIRGAYIHSLLLTDNFVILCIWPAYFRHHGASLLWERNILDSITPWSKHPEDPSNRATWLVVDRRQGRGLVGKFQSPPFFCFHTVNAWEQPSVGDSGSVDLVCELFQFDNTDIMHQLYLRNLVSNALGAHNLPMERSFDHAGLARYKLKYIPLSGKVKLQEFPSQVPKAEKIMYIPSPQSGDLPRINPNYSLKPHRYVWGMCDRGKSSFVDGLVKTDTHMQTCTYWEKEKHTPGEPIFIPNPSGVAEDDGAILCVVLNDETGNSYLLCLDAQNMTEMGRVEVGAPIGLGFHGKHIPKRA
ncbi:hypothetical protein PRZ48_006699 [Zasmidium cellare]|uniref:Carotenoid oxygenase n=1 Tax=Zasmidium cellare TaxID=395010 RepID=A0ABR0EQ68_ZASCE|nr:hypothetical protein PRZ48_006699 [Zasmidium cellare]